MDRPRMTLPAYSITCPVAPAALIWAMMARITSLAVTPSPSVPSTVMRMVFGLRCHRVCVASTCATSVLPMPKASAPRAPWVEVWLSPQTSSIPGWDRPVSGPTTWMMPWLGSPRPNMRMPCSAVLRASFSTISRWRGSWISAMVRLSVAT